MDDRNTSWILRIVGVGGWTLIHVAGWLWFMWAMEQDAEIQAEPLAQSCGCLVASAGCGTSWFVGVVVAAVLYALLRR